MIPVLLRIFAHCFLKKKVGEKYLLLIGNQGVGKNKISDRLLQLLRLEREYMQLHRDTTVQALTLSPSLVEVLLHCCFSTLTIL
jgi:MoxR-like ATPase